ncbi:MAG: hypothetical protein NC180_02915 [Muribaculaceae bacterium]|nr:hypothetical protein [Roseburia sp.]MCM1430091.1 hypothetical protein [Muribaculaceae bacterium]MCM1492156.1 hypothetical protein [Muribaculaceae bacterium]
MEALKIKKLYDQLVLSSVFLLTGHLFSSADFQKLPHGSSEHHILPQTYLPDPMQLPHHPSV